jgi:hypothetical protein
MKKLKNLLFAIPLLFLGIMISCNDDNSGSPDQENPAENQEVIINNDISALNDRLDIKNDIVKMIPSYEYAEKSTTIEDYDYTKNFAFKLRADVNPPTINLVPLMATHVAIKDDYAFVSYNTRGNEYGGAVEIFDVSNPTQPFIVSQGVFPYADINAVDYSDGKIYIAGALFNYEQLEFNGPALFWVLSVNDQMQINSVDQVIDVRSYSANSIKVTEDKIYVTSGDQGGLTIFDKFSYEEIDYIATSDARSIDINSTNIYAFSGTPGKIDVYDKLTNEFTFQIETGGANTPYAKSQLAVNDEFIFTALSEEGAKMFSTAGEFIRHFPKPTTPEGELEENYVTNSLTLNNQLVFMANGHAGISVGEIVPELDNTVVMLGSMVFEDLQSSNFVMAQDSIVFVASGLGGLKILSISIEEGIPDNIISTTPCPTLMTNITESLPEQKNAMNHSPWLFNPDNFLNVKTAVETDVYLSFIFEGAGWRNTFGYYAYPADNPPLTLEDLEQYVVFPNVSMLNEGGGLEPGDMVRLGNEPFPANTVIGFYIVAKGWANGQMVDGLYTHFTNTELNYNNNQQHILFVEDGCQDLVIGLEDKRVGTGDNDFNDIIIAIKDNKDELPNTKFDVNGIPHLNLSEVEK